MSEKNVFIDAVEIADITGRSIAYAYKLIKELNKELEEKGYFTLRGLVSRQYFEERFYGTRM